MRIRLSAGFVEFAERRCVTAEDMRRCAERACRVMLPRGHEVRYARILHFVADEQEVDEPVGVECGRLGAQALLAISEG